MCCKAAQDHILRIDDVPLTDCITGFWTICTHALAYLLFRVISSSALKERRGVRVPVRAQRVKTAYLMLKNRLGALINPTITAKDQEACEAPSEPAIMRHSYHRPLVAIERLF